MKRVHLPESLGQVHLDLIPEVDSMMSVNDKGTIIGSGKILEQPLHREVPIAVTGGVP